MRSHSHGRGPARLPYKQLLILVICRLAEPIALTSVFPYLPEMITSFGVPDNEIGKWAGLVSAMFSMCQCITGIPWGTVSDIWGRKPVIIISLVCTMITTLLFGVSTSLTMAIVVRAIGGASNGNVGTMRTAVAEMVPWKELQPRAFSIMPLVWSVGSIFGPALGGALVFPAERYPGLFGHSSLLIKYPFLLPNLIAASLFFIGATTGFFFLEESLESKRDRKDYGRLAAQAVTRACGRVIARIRPTATADGETEPLLHSSAEAVDNEQQVDDCTSDSTTLDASKTEDPHRWKHIFTVQSTLNILCYAGLALHSITFDQLIPVFMHSPYQDPSSPDIHLPFHFVGGFGINSNRIGFWLTLNAISSAPIQFLVYPPVARRFGVRRTLRVVSMIVPVLYMIVPYTALLPRGLKQQIALFCLMLTKSIVTAFAFPCTAILLTNSASTLSVLGTLNGVATTASGLMRAVGPALCGYVYTVGWKHGYVLAAWWLLAGIALIAALPAFWLEEGKDHARDATEDGEEEDAQGEDRQANINEDEGYGGSEDESRS